MGKLQDQEVFSILKQKMLDFSFSVIKGRSIPDVRDGLKPIHRRLIFSMKSLGLNGSNTKKSARIVGDTMGRFHPHGDASIYEALIRMGQTFVHSTPLVTIQGNCGSLKNPKEFAAMRYTEAKLHKIAEEFYQDLQYNCVKLVPTFDGNELEPEVLPAAFPNILISSSSGIAVGFATNVLPFNLGEVLDGTIKIIENPEITDKELIKFIQGPDFPTAGVITNKNELLSILKTGRGSIKITSKIDIKGNTIIVKEIPYTLSINNIIESIVETTKSINGKPPVINEISEIHDYSKKEVDIHIKVKKGFDPEIVLVKLLKFTRLQTSLKYSATVIDINGVPNELGVKEIIQQWLSFRQECLLKKNAFLYKQAKDRIHILKGFLIVFEHPAEAIKIIRSSADDDEAIKNLTERFELSKTQATAILNLQVRRFAKSNILKTKKELNEQIRKMKYHKERINDHDIINKDIITELSDIKAKYAVPRKTIIENISHDIEESDLVEDSDFLIYLSNKGLIKKVATTFNSQKKGGKGRKVGLRDNDYIKNLLYCKNKDILLVITSLGKVHKLPAYKIPEYTLDKIGKNINTLINLAENETITTIFPIKDYEKYELILLTRQSYIKRFELKELDVNRKTGLIVTKLSEDDEVISCQLIEKNKVKKTNLIVSIENGKIVYFKAEELPLGKRITKGMKAAKKGKKAISLSLSQNPDDILILVTNDGIGKRVRISDFNIKKRRSAEVMAIKLKENSLLVDCAIVNENDEIVIVTNKKNIKIKVAQIRLIRKVGFGSKLVNLDEDDSVYGFSIITNEDEQ
jgi:DNA gyrase subunit A